jgi:hypothetical protein
MIGRRLLVYGCLAAGTLAAPAIATAQQPSYKTPGATAKVNMKELCAADFATSLKPVAGWQRREALERYGVRSEGFSGELDHLVPASLGGSNDPDNLWPFRASGSYTFEAKQALAMKLHDMGRGQHVSEYAQTRSTQGLDEGVSAAAMTALNAPGQKGSPNYVQR